MYDIEAKRTVVTNSLGHATTYQGNENGLVVEQLDRGDGVRPLAAVENANGFALTFAYDAQGHLAQITDSAGRNLYVCCDAQGRLLSDRTRPLKKCREKSASNLLLSGKLLRMLESRSCCCKGCYSQPTGQFGA